MKKYYLISLGCPKNLVDSEIFAGILDNAGYIATNTASDAELIIVNTCGFILDAKQEAIDTILEMAEYKTTGKCKTLIATGCLVKRYFEDLKRDLPEIDHLVNLKDFSHFAKIIKTTPGEYRTQLSPPHYAYLRISDGCNNHCSYCAIPAIRGKLISEPSSLLIKKAKEMAASGVKELIITAQDTTQYGMDIDGKSHLVELLKQLEEIDGIDWLRLLYLHPAHLSDEMIDHICQSKKICHYFEIPMQHASDKLLAAMNRHVTRERQIEIINRIRKQAPDAVIRTTFIVGHPGETEQDYEQLMDFIEDMRFERLGIFTYSKEEGTASALQDNEVDEDSAQLRMDQLMSIQMEISAAVMERYLNQTISVIIDEVSSTEDFDLIGRTRFDSPDIDGLIYIYGTAQPGDIVQVKIIDTWEYDLVGKIITKGEPINE